jgi:hypothetical protein
MEKTNEFIKNSNLDMCDEIAEINSNRAVFRKYEELSDDKWPRDY